MNWIALILATLSIGFNAFFSHAFVSSAFGMGGPVYIDTVCETIRAAPASPALKSWIKAQCPRGEQSSAPICVDFSRFIRDVAANNEIYRRKCGGAP